MNSDIIDGNDLCLFYLGVKNQRKRRKPLSDLLQIANMQFIEECPSQYMKVVCVGGDRFVVILNNLVGFLNH